jgi:hypothetical protein
MDVYKRMPSGARDQSGCCNADYAYSSIVLPSVLNDDSKARVRPDAVAAIGLRNSCLRGKAAALDNTGKTLAMGFGVAATIALETCTLEV